MLPLLLLFATHPLQGVGGQWTSLRAVGIQENESFGFAVAILSDLDGDLVRDVLVGSPGHDGVARGSGRMGVISGRDLRTPIHVVRGDRRDGSLGRAVAGAGDVDGDGVEDFMGMYIALRNLSGPGTVVVHSGATGARLLEIVSPEYSNHEFGGVLAGPGDLDVDGHDDLLISNLTFPFAVMAVSGAGGGILYEARGNGQDLLGSQIAVLGLVDADAVPDFAVSATGGRDVNGRSTGAVHVFSGATGSLLYRLEGIQENSGFGSSLAAITDLDGDEVRDLLVGAKDYEAGGIARTGAAFLFSGRTGMPLRSLYGIHEYGAFGSAAAGIGDVTGDGAGDFAVGEDGFPGHSLHNGRVLVFDGAAGAPLGALETPARHGGNGDVLAGALEAGEGPILLDGAYGTETAFGDHSGAVLAYEFHPYLSSDPHSISAATGGSVRFALDFGASSANQPYLLLPSLTGTGPESLGQILVPLSFDGATRRWLQGPPSYAIGFSGRLGPEGSASAELLLAPGAAGSLAGSSAWFAALLLDAWEGLVSSIAVRLTITP